MVGNSARDLYTAIKTGQKKHAPNGELRALSSECDEWMDRDLPKQENLVDSDQQFRGRGIPQRS
jgi:hypothetical protein